MLASCWLIFLSLSLRFFFRGSTQTIWTEPVIPKVTLHLISLTLSLLPNSFYFPLIRIQAWEGQLVKRKQNVCIGGKRDCELNLRWCLFYYSGFTAETGHRSALNAVSASEGPGPIKALLRPISSLWEAVFRYQDPMNNFVNPRQSDSTSTLYKNQQEYSF